MAGPWEKYQQAEGPWLKYQEASAPQPEAPDTPPEYSLANNIAQGAIRGAADIGTTLLWPVDALKDLVSPKQRTLADVVAGTKPMTSHEKRKTQIDEVMREVADTDSLGFKGGRLGTQVAGTLGVGGALGAGAKAIGLPAIATALESGGMTLGALKQTAMSPVANFAANAAMRAGAGAVTGATSAGLIDPSQAGAGAILGGAMPAGAQMAGALGSKVAGQVSPAVSALAEKAKQLGIDVPLDRLTNSRPLNALAASLNYVPFSGRMATENRMLSQLNRAASRTMGQDSDNIADAIRAAKTELGQKFDDVLKTTSVNMDGALTADLDAVRNIATSELAPEQAKIILNQIDNIAEKGAAGAIYGQAAYNIKKTLDRIGKRNSPEAHYANELRGKLIDALNRSLGPADAEAFAQVRQQYGNMMSLRGLVPNGAEAQISAGRLGNLRNIKNKELQDVADVAAQFVRSRENPHGAAQRVGMYALGAGAAIPAPLAAGALMGAGRLANTALNSDVMRRLLLSPAYAESMLSNPLGRTIPLTLLASPAGRQ